MFQALGDKLEGVFRKLRGLGKISESNINDALREVRMALLEADVEFSVAKDFIARVKEKALGAEVLKSITPGQQIVKIFHDELTELLGGDASPLDLNPPARILVVGLNGAGKTTTSAKLARLLKSQGRKPALIALDLYRPAAIQQLAVLAEEVGVPIYLPEAGEKNVLKAAKAAVKWLETQSATVAIFDTAGRQEVDGELIAELKDVRNFLQPREVLLVADAATGQQAVNVATTFNEAVGITGLILTKLDGDARGGAALSMRSVTQRPIKFIGVGEKMDQLEVFVPDRLAGRILNMGDVVGLVEKAAQAIDEEDAMKMMSKLDKKDFDFNDFLDQMKMMRKIAGGGGMMGLLSMLPGIGKQLKQLKGQVNEDELKRTEAIVFSMTPRERIKPEILNGKRRARIAKGSGNSVMAVNDFLKRFGEMRKMMKNKGQMMKMMQQMGGGMPGMPGMPGMGGGGPSLGGFPGMGGLGGGGGRGGLGGGGGMGRVKFPKRK